MLREVLLKVNELRRIRNLAEVTEVTMKASWFYEFLGNPKNICQIKLIVWYYIKYNSFHIDMVDGYSLFELYNKPVRYCSV